MRDVCTLLRPGYESKVSGSGWWLEHATLITWYIVLMLISIESWSGSSFLERSDMPSGQLVVLCEEEVGQMPCTQSSDKLPGDGHNVLRVKLAFKVVKHVCHKTAMMVHLISK